MARKYEASREDLSVQQAHDILGRSMEKDDVNGSIRTYYTVLNSLGHGAGIGFFDQVVRPFIEHLLKNGKPGEALQAVKQARQTLRVEPNAQLDRELSALTDRVQGEVR